MAGARSRRLRPLILAAVLLGACTSDPGPAGETAAPGRTPAPPAGGALVPPDHRPDTTPPGPHAAAFATCDPSYPDACIPPPPPDLDCDDVSFRNFAVTRGDPHGFDDDGDGRGC